MSFILSNDSLLALYCSLKPGFVYTIDVNSANFFKKNNTQINFKPLLNNTRLMKVFELNC